MQSQSRLELNNSWYSKTQNPYRLCQIFRPERMVHIITTGLNVHNWNSVPSGCYLKPYHPQRPMFIRLLVGVFMFKHFSRMT